MVSRPIFDGLGLSLEGSGLGLGFVNIPDHNPSQLAQRTANCAYTQISRNIFKDIQFLMLQRRYSMHWQSVKIYQ